MEVEPLDRAESFVDRNWIDCQRFRYDREPVLRKVGIKNQKCLTRDRESQLHPGEHDKPVFGGQGVTARREFIRGRISNERKEAQIMMVRYCNSSQAGGAGRCDQLRGINAAAIVVGRSFADPIRVARRMNLKVASIEVRALVHDLMLTSVIFHAY
jgi:hypothetical protein